MCTQLISNLMGKSKAAQQIIPAREADDARDADAVIKDSTDSTSEVTSEGTGVSVKRTKKPDRRGVPGLNL
jgi:hypothetical protein